MDKSRGRSSRKSLLRCGRRGRRSLAPVINSSLHENIPLSLPPEERLEEFLKCAFESAVCSVKPMLASEKAVSVNGFTTDASKLYEDIDKVLKEDKLYEFAVVEPLHQRCDDVDCVECKQIEEYSNSISRLQGESEEWNRIFSAEREKLQDVVNASTEPVEHQVKDDKYCYSSIRDKITDIGVAVECLAKEFSSADDTFACALRLANSSIDALNSKMSSYLDTSSETPRTLIKNMTLQPKIESDITHL